MKIPLWQLALGAIVVFFLFFKNGPKGPTFTNPWDRFAASNGGDSTFPGAGPGQVDS